MGNYERKDRFYQKAKDEGRASRASYKLEQLQQRYKIIKKGDNILDLGCAPGGWLEVASKLVGPAGRILGIDVLPIKTVPRVNTVFIQADINDLSVSDTIKEKLGRIDVVLSDMAPNTSGVKFRDSYLSYELANVAFQMAKKFLRGKGNFVVKIFPGEDFAGFKKEMQKCFERVEQYRPEATRKTSIEVYLVGLKYTESSDNL